MSLPPTPPSSGPPSPAFTSRSNSPIPDGDDQQHSYEGPHNQATITAALHALPHAESSNLPALQRQHMAAGYRAGVSTGRDDPECAQRGFDEGYPVGALLGMAAGFLGALGEVQGRLGNGGAGADGAGIEAPTLDTLIKEMENLGLMEGDETTPDGAKKQWSLPDGWLDRLQALAKQQEKARRICREWDVDYASAKQSPAETE